MNNLNVAKIQLNGDAYEINQGTDLNELLNKLKIEKNKVAIEVNGEIVEKNKYENLVLNKNDEILTSNHEYAETIRKLSLHGISTDAWNRYSNTGSWFYEVTDAGYKYNMSDILASIGCVQIKKAETFLDKRTAIAKIYTEELKDLDAMFLPKSSPHIKHSWHLFVIMLNTNKLTINRNNFIEELKKLNIGSSVHFIPLHRHKYYQNTFNYKSVDFPNSEWVYQRTISLPIYPEMTKTDTYDVINAIKHIVSQYQK